MLIAVIAVVVVIVVHGVPSITVTPVVGQVERLSGSVCAVVGIHLSNQQDTGAEVITSVII